MRASLTSCLQKTLVALLLCLASACAVSPEVTFDPGTDFRLDLSASQVVVPQGGQGSAGVQVTWLGNCGCPDVQLTVAGAPTGLSAQFDSPATASGTTLFLQASGQVAAGTYRLQVTGIRGSLVHSQPLDVYVPGPAADFTLALNPAYLPVAQGGSGTVGITVQRSGGFAEAIALSLAGAPAGVTGTFSGAPLGIQGLAPAGPATLLLSVGAAVPVGPRTLTIQATSASRSHAVTFILDIQTPADFAMTLAPPTVNATSGTGSAGPVAITLTRSATFTAAVGFILEGAPAGCSGTFTPATTTGSSSSLAMTLAGVAPGTYPLTVRASAGTLSHTATLLLTVAAPAPDFTLQPVSVSAAPGGSGSAGVVIVPVNSFTGAVSLSATGLPAGVTTTFTPNPATPSGGSTLAVTVPSSVAPGTYTGSFRGVSGTLDHSATLTLLVTAPGDFGLNLSPSGGVSVQVPRGGSNSGTASVQIQPSGGFSGTVNFTLENLPTGVTGSFSPNPATSSTTLTLNVSGQAAPGSYTLTVRGVSGTLNHTAPLGLTLTPPQDVNVSLSPGSGSAAIPFSGIGTLTAAVTLAPVNGFSGSVNLAATGLPAGVTAAFSPNPAAVPGSSTMTLTITSAATPGTTTFSVEATQGPLTASASYTLTLTPTGGPDFTITPQLPAVTEQPGSSGTLTVTVASVNGFSGSVVLGFQNAPAGMSGIVSPNPVIVPAGGSAATTLYLTTGSSVLGGVYNTQIRGSGGNLLRTGALQVTVQDFTLSASPSAFSFATGGGISGGGTIAITRLQGLANSISFSATLPGFQFVFTPSSTTGNSVGFSFTGPTLSPAAPGVYPVVVTGNAGTWTRSTPLSITVQGFLITLMPSETSSIGLPPTIRVQTTPVGGTTGAATLAMTAGPFFTGSFAPNPVTLGSASNWTWTFVSTPGAGTYTYTVSGTAGAYAATRNLSHTITFTADYYLHVTDSGSANLVSVVPLPAGTSASLKVFLDPVNGFTLLNGWPPVPLSISGAPAGLTAGFSPGSIDSTSSSTLTLTASPGLPSGTYFVDVVGAVLTYSHKATLLIVVP